MDIIVTIIIGFIAGVLAKLIMPGRNEPSGFIMTTILGIVGAVLASFLAGALGLGGADGFIGRIIAATIGALILLFIWGMIAGRRRA